MNARTLFARAAIHWPASVELLSPQKSASSELGFPALASVNSDVERCIDFSTDHWGNIAAWSFYQAATSVAREFTSQGRTTLWIKDIPIEVFDECVRKNLAGADFAEERLQYIGI
jgi:hypothetical protein